MLPHEVVLASDFLIPELSVAGPIVPAVCRLALGLLSRPTLQIDGTSGKAQREMMSKMKQSLKVGEESRLALSLVSLRINICFHF